LVSDEPLVADATAAILRRVPDLAGSFANEMLGLRAGVSTDTFSVRTQQHVPGVGFLDLVLDDGSERVVWIEIKDWAPESGSNQLHKYWEALQECTHPHGQLVYLTRSGQPAGGAPAVTPYKWRDFAAFVEVCLVEHRASLDTYQAWLVEDYLRYLRERGLMRSDTPLKPGFTACLGEFNLVAAQLLDLREFLVERLAERGWPRPPTSSLGFGGRNAADWSDWWGAYAPQPPDRFPAGSAFDFGMLNLMGERPALYVTGLWLGEAWDPDELQSWLAHFVAQPTHDGFGAFELPEEHGGVRLCRSLRADELPNATLADQAAAMADLTVKTFAMLERNPPPPIRGSMPN
jgi:hypothetical protein